MNILFYQHQYPAFGGIETVTTMLANAFADDGHNVAIVSFIHKDGTDLLEQLEKRIMWYELPEPSLDSAENRESLVEILRNFKPDQIILQDSYANIQHLLWEALSEWKGFDGKQLFVVEHSAPQFSVARHPKALDAIECLKRVVLFFLTPISLLRRLRFESLRRRELFDHADAYIVLSKNYIDRVRLLVGSKRISKLRVIPNPTGAPPLVLDMRRKGKQILFVGSLIPLKGVDRLLSAWKRLSPRHADWEFVIVGDGSERQRLEAMVASANMPNVRFEGFQRNLASYYQDASIFVMASDFEGWPMVLGEAMQYGCVPVVYDSFAAASDIIDDGVCGRVIRHFHTVAFVKAVDEIMNNTDKRIKMAEIARKKASCFTIQQIKTKWYFLFMEHPANMVL